MKKLMNTLYVTSENSYLVLDGENIVIYDDRKELGRVPLHNLYPKYLFLFVSKYPRLMRISLYHLLFRCLRSLSGVLS